MTTDPRRQRWLASGAVCAVFVCLLTACGDPQSAALSRLTARGYALSVPEFLRAAQEGDADVLRSFVAAGIDPNVKDAAGVTALECAISAGKLEAVDTLRDCGAAIARERGQALLLAAVRSRAPPVLQWLLEHGVVPKPGAEISPLVLAARHSQPAMVEALLPHSSDHVQSALFAASASGDVAVLSRLVRAGGNLWAAESHTRRTPLIIATSAGNEAAVELMLACGVDPFQLDAAHRCALEHAQAGGFERIASLLMAAPHVDVVADPLAGASLRTRGDAAQALTLGRLVYLRCTQQALPFHLETLEEVTATVRLAKDDRVETLTQGQIIPDTAWQIGARKVVPPFSGVLIHLADSAPQDSCWLLPQRPARRERLCAVLRDAADGHLYETVRGDTFSLTGTATLELVIRDITGLQVTLAEASGSGASWVLSLGGKRL